VRLWLGTFDTVKEAARRYDFEARRLRGPLVITNFPATPDDCVPLLAPSLSLHVVAVVGDHSFVGDESQLVIFADFLYWMAWIARKKPKSNILTLTF
jgi:hypothetical protein